jgi:hypothetical protein
MEDLSRTTSFAPSAPPLELIEGKEGNGNVEGNVKDERKGVDHQSPLTFNVIRAWRLRDSESDHFRCCVSSDEESRHFLFILAPNSLHRIDLKTGFCRMIVPDICHLRDQHCLSLADCNPFQFQFTPNPEKNPKFTAIAVWNSSIFVSDAANCRILVFTFDGILQHDREIKTMKYNWEHDPKPVRQPAFGLVVLSNYGVWPLKTVVTGQSIKKLHTEEIVDQLQPLLITTVEPDFPSRTGEIRNIGLVVSGGVQLRQYVGNQKTTRFSRSGGEDFSPGDVNTFIAGDIICASSSQHRESPKNEKFEEATRYYICTRVLPYIWRFETFIFINKTVMTADGNNEIHVREQRHGCTHAFRHERFPLRTASAEGICYHEGMTFVCAKNENCIQVYDEKMNHLLNFNGRKTWESEAFHRTKPSASPLCNPTGIAASPQTGSVFVVSKGGYVWEFAWKK